MRQRNKNYKTKNPLWTTGLRGTVSLFISLKHITKFYYYHCNVHFTFHYFVDLKDGLIYGFVSYLFIYLALRYLSISFDTGRQWVPLLSVEPFPSEIYFEIHDFSR